jgi:uncharacterized RDD family membrane protein YckC
MSEGSDNDRPKRPMPWETGGDGPPPDPTPPEEPPPSDDGSPTTAGPTPEPGSDAAPTEVVPTPEPIEPVEPAASEPSDAAAAPADAAMPPDATTAAPAAGLISAAPVGWGAEQPVAPATPDPNQPAVGWGTPQIGRQAVPGAQGFVFADTASRVVGWLIDWFISWILAFIVAAIVVALLYGGGILEADSSRLGNAVVWIVALLVNLAYFLFFWTGGRRATPGQRMFRIQVGNAHDGHDLDLTQAAVRWLGYGFWFPIFGLLPALAGLVGLLVIGWPFVLLFSTIVSSTKQGLHDRLAGTWVVRPEGGGGSAGVLLGCLVIAVLVVIISFVGLIFLGSQMSSILSAVGDSI